MSANRLILGPHSRPAGSTRWGSQHPPYLPSPFFRFGKQTQGGEAKNKIARNDTINQFNWNVRLDRRIEVTILPSFSSAHQPRHGAIETSFGGDSQEERVRKCLIPATNAAHRLAAWRRQNRVRKGEGKRGSPLDVCILVGRGSGMYDGTVKDELAELISVKDPC